MFFPSIYISLTPNRSTSVITAVLALDKQLIRVSAGGSNGTLFSDDTDQNVHDI